VVHECDRRMDRQTDRYATTIAKSHVIVEVYVHKFLRIQLAAKT